MNKEALGIAMLERDFNLKYSKINLEGLIKREKELIDILINKKNDLEKNEKEGTEEYQNTLKDLKNNTKKLEKNEKELEKLEKYKTLDEQLLENDIEKKISSDEKRAKLAKDSLKEVSRFFDIDKVMAMLEEGMTSKLKTEEDKKHFREGLELAKAFLKGEASVDDYQEFDKINIKEL